MDVSRPALRVVIAPDSFKHCLGAADVAGAIAEGWASARPHDRLVLRPMADGGEGTLDAFAAASAGAVVRRIEVTGPDRRPRMARWLLLPGGTAVVELAESSGIELMTWLDPIGATTHGLGEVLLDVLAESAVDRILVGLGGSASTDGGRGALLALGARLLDGAGVEVEPDPTGLETVVRVDLGAIPQGPPGGIVCLSDVTVPLLGPRGAARQFAPQKGADTATVALLEAALARWARLLGDPGDAPGSGAAGGTAYGLVRGLGATLEPGAAVVMDLLGLRGELARADVVITGEGRYDAQSGQGKVVGTVLSATPEGTSRFVICGVCDVPAEPGVIETTGLAGGVPASFAEPGRWLRVAGARAARSIGVAGE